MADLATLQARLTEAESAYHRLLTGSQAEEVQHGDMRQRYTKSDTSQLASYIESLRAQIAVAGGTLDGLQRRGLIIDL